jgi:sulfhydrogenase subunit beta (sulfur reductase)
MKVKLFRLDRNGLEDLIQILRKREYEVIGPQVRDSAVVYEPISGSEDLAAGWSTESDAGRYRLVPRPGEAVFAYSAGPDSAKKYLHPPRERLISAQRENGHFHVLPERRTTRKYAFFGLRPCDLAAVAVQDRVLLKDRYVDEAYQANRKEAFFVVAQCTSCAPTCFCASFESGPRAASGFDLALTERESEQGLEYLLEVGSSAGLSVADELKAVPAPAEWVKEATAAARAAGAGQKRSVNMAEARAVIDRNFESPRWEQTAQRCLACGNCTQVCPTCFCINTVDSSSLDTRHAERWRVWDSCFTQNFTYIHGGSVRLSVKSRYRQWLSHKLVRWQEQFGEPGCVGCGRCITWCPAGIDITEEMAALAGSA